jgi:hypothetical protein
MISRRTVALSRAADSFNASGDFLFVKNPCRSSYENGHFPQPMLQMDAAGCALAWAGAETHGKGPLLDETSNPIAVKFK